MPILKIEKLTKKYGKTYALNGLDMEVKKGDIYGFVGPNGAGKTTTLRIISGLLKSDGGVGPNNITSPSANCSMQSPTKQQPRPFFT